MTITHLVDKYHANRATYLRADYNETQFPVNIILFRSVIIF
jgi:hypothetical protein